MALSSELISQFVQVTKEEKQNKETTVYGTIKETDHGTYVQLDGSTLLTPISSSADDNSDTGLIATADVRDGERVTVMIKDHRAIVTGNLTSPSARVADVNEIRNDVITCGQFIQDLETNKLNADAAEIKYANIDFANIGEAAIKKIFSDSGIIEDLVVSEGRITGELVGVTIKGDLIEGNTIVADKLVVKGSDGILYKLNVDAAGLSKEEAPTDTLDGNVLTAKSVVADKIAVTDLVAFGATIGGFRITDDAIYSGVKTGPTNTTRGIYMDNTGQWSIGDSNNYLRYYNVNGTYKLEVSASSIRMQTGTSSTSTSLEEKLDSIESDLTTVKDNVTTILKIESSRGTVFKNDKIDTVLSVVIYRGSTVITDMDALKSVMGETAYLEWSWQRLDDADYGTISADDSRIGNSGFTFTLSPDDVNTKVTFKCTLNT